MSATAEEVLRTLQSIDAGIKALLAHFGATTQPPAPSADTRPVPTVASDRDLDSQYGNPEVKAKDPRDWSGDSMKGKRFSECPIEYLNLVADRLEYFAEQNEATNANGKTAEERLAELKKARYNRLDASRARGWAQRLRNGWTPPAEAEGFPSDGAAAAPLNNDDIPFTWLLPLMLPALMAWHAASTLC